MFVGHIAVALAAKEASRDTSLVWFIAAATFVDLLWPILLLAGLESVRIDPGNTFFTPLSFVSYPWTHSLAMGVAWGVAFGAVARWRGVSATGAKLVGALVVSHWVLDFITHRPDLTLWPGASTPYGLGLWNSISGTYLVEGALWLTGIVLFLGVRRPVGAKGRIAFWSFLLVNTLLWATAPYSPPPPDERSLAYFALIGWIVLPWAWWIERTSEMRRRKA